MRRLRGAAGEYSRKVLDGEAWIFVEQLTLYEALEQRITHLGRGIGGMSGRSPVVIAM